MREVLGFQSRSEKQNYSQEDTECTEDDSLSVAYRPIDNLCLSFRYGIEALVDRREEYIMEFVLLPARTKHSRTKHRHKAERTASGDDHDDADDPSELAEHDT